jgi:Dyp-type peroxidase family
MTTSSQGAAGRARVLASLQQQDGGEVAQQMVPRLDLDEIQGDLLVGMHKNAQLFIFFQIAHVARFKALAKQYLAGRLTNARTAQQREQRVYERKRRQEARTEPWLGLSLGFTKEALTQLLGPSRPRLDPAFERGANHPDTLAVLNDPPLSEWLAEFRSERIDGVFLIAGPDRSFVHRHESGLREQLGTSVKIVYSEMGKVRPQRGHEHFGFLDGISNPGVRGLTRPSQPIDRPDEGLPGQDLIWPGEFVFGYPGQHPTDPHKPGPEPEMAAPWMRNGSYMVFRRLKQKVPEFRRFVREQAARLGMDPQLLMARMVGRWQSGAPLELAPRYDDPRLGADDERNNDFAFGEDPEQRKCPFAAHIRRMYPRDEGPGGEAEAQRHRIMRAGIPFGPEVEPGEIVTRHQRGLMFVCYQTSIDRQFESLQRRANDPDLPAGKPRPGGRTAAPGYDPMIGQAPGNGARRMDEPYPNYPAGSRRTTLEIPRQFVELTAAGYFFMPSISALRTVLTS